MALIAGTIILLADATLAPEYVLSSAVKTTAAPWLMKSPHTIIEVAIVK